MQFEVITYDNKEKWKEFVDNNCEIYYQWDYVSAFYKNMEGLPILPYATDGENIIFETFFKRDIAEDDKFKNRISSNKYFDLITPYGYGGINFKGKYQQDLKEYYEKSLKKYCIENNIISAFERFNPILKNNIYDSESVYCSKTVYMKLEDKEQIWNDLQSRARNTIRKAIKNDVLIEIGFNKKMFDEFKEIYIETMRRDNANEYYFFSEEFFEDYYNNMKSNSIIVTAYKDNIAISSSLFIFLNGNAHYHLSGTKTEYLKYGANSLILYEAACELLNKGCSKLHLGGGYGGDNSPLLKFKMSFSKEPLLDFYISKKIFNAEEYNKLVGMRMGEIDCNSQFFPLYRS